MEEKKTNQAEDLQKLVDTWSAMNKYSFYVGTQRGIMSSINTICLRFAGMSFDEYTKKMIKPQLNQLFTTGQAIQLLAGLLNSVNELIALAEMEAKKEVEKENENESKSSGLVTEGN